MDDEWSVVFYTEAGGREPIRDFLASLDPKAQVRFGRAIDQLARRYVQAGEPLVRHLEDKLWELRIESGTNAYRMLYFFFTGRQIVFVHGFQKKTQKTPRRDLELALRRMDVFLGREGGNPR